MPIKQIIIEYSDAQDLISDFENHLTHGGIFARGATGFEQAEPCDVVLVHPRNKTNITLRATVVMVVPSGDDKGLGIAISNFDPGKREKLRAFVEDTQPCDAGAPAPRKTDEGNALQNIQTRLRNLSITEQVKLARSSANVNERVLLERIFGKSVWEPLLRNARISVPEVARISRMGALPRPMLELIVANTAWLNATSIRRALLQNPRLTGEMIAKVLRATPRRELKLIPKQTVYSTGIRTAARKLLT